MSEMVELVARAIRPTAFREGARSEWHDQAREDARTVARAAIGAMREPTEAMALIGAMATYPNAEETWRAQIDEALK